MGNCMVRKTYIMILYTYIYIYIIKYIISYNISYTAPGQKTIYWNSCQMHCPEKSVRQHVLLSHAYIVAANAQGRVQLHQCCFNVKTKLCIHCHWTNPGAWWCLIFAWRHFVQSAFNTSAEDDATKRDPRPSVQRSTAWQGNCSSMNEYRWGATIRHLSSFSASAAAILTPW